MYTAKRVWGHTDNITRERRSIFAKTQKKELLQQTIAVRGHRGFIGLRRLLHDQKTVFRDRGGRWSISVQLTVAGAALE